MPSNLYECLVLLDTTKVAGNLDDAKNGLHTILERHGCEILASRPWDERRLAYPVGGQKKGLYYLIYFRSEGKAITPVEADFRITENILRTIILNIPEKWHDTMLELARDPHALALQSAVDEPMEGGPPRRDPAHEPGTPGEESSTGPGRRGRRPAELELKGGEA